ncbi:MAG: hypothetical protein Q9169_006917 [Polycauliona sp. 2 TL-2023]
MPLVQSLLQYTVISDAVGMISTPKPQDAATEEATFARPTEYGGPLTTSEVTITAEWIGPTSILSLGVSSTISDIIPPTNAPAVASSLSTTKTSTAEAAAALGNASLWLGGGDVLAPAVVAVIVVLPLLIVAGLVWLVCK